MDIQTAIKVVQRRLVHLNKRIEDEKGSESALMFDTREKEALEFIVNELSPPRMAEEVNENSLSKEFSSTSS
jgi:hypothetical protein